MESRLHERSLHAAAPDFDRLAHIYRWMEWFSFGPFLARCRCAFLRLLNNRHAALVLGDGDGRFTARLLRENRSIVVDAVDASAAMLEELGRRARCNGNRVETHLSDARAFVPMCHGHDLVVTHFFLDCLTAAEVKSLATRLRTYACDDAVWVLSEFAVPSSRCGRAVSRLIISFLYRVFGLLTGLEIRDLPNHRRALTQAGWILERERKHLGGLLVSEMWHVNPATD